MKYFPEVCMIIRQVTQMVEKSWKLVCFQAVPPTLCFFVTTDWQICRHETVPKLTNGKGADNTYALLFQASFFFFVLVLELTFEHLN